MASNSLGILAKATRRPLRKFLRLKNQEKLFRFYSALSCGKPGRQLIVSGRRCFSALDPNIIKSDYDDIVIPDMPFHEFIFQNFGRYENKTAVECAATGKKLLYKDLLRCSRALASCLQKKFKLKKNDVQAIVLPNCPEYPIIYLAGSLAGVISTTINPVYTSTEISLQLQDVKPKVLYTVPESYAKCLEAMNAAKMNIPIVVVKNTPEAQIPQGAVSFSELTEDSVDCEPVSSSLEDDLVYPFSSGTSGLPKGVRLSHKNIISNLIQYFQGNDLKINCDVRETDQCSILGVLPMFHIYGMVIVTFDSLREGAKLVTLPRFEPKLFMETIVSKKTEILYLVPPLVIFLGNSPAVESKHFTHARHIINGAAPCGDSDIEKVKKKASHLQFSQGYGMTETSPVIAMSHRERFHKITAAGHPIASTFIKIADLTTGKPLPVNSRGEIYVKGPQVMKGYFNRPEETKKTFDDEGWLKTGDIGYYDEDRDIFVVDRLKELIKVKGFQVAPAEIEEFLRSHPKINDAGVIGVDHPELGQAPKAFVVLKDGASATEDDIKNFIKERLSSYKQLSGGVHFIKEIPKSNAGKILRKELKRLYGNS